ncbi:MULTISPECIES: hypothetical protein [Aeromonas]|uniref:hypothetical protein n=1 Tax=Aeromonas TaxID=642 RepID=UPI0005B45D0F|nr:MULTISPECIES: hypothetical protein [Aeromonas]TNH76504.1 hypothetical protein CF142_04330 [Aeromonas caviae]
MHALQHYTNQLLVQSLANAATSNGPVLSRDIAIEQAFNMAKAATNFAPMLAATITQPDSVNPRELIGLASYCCWAAAQLQTLAMESEGQYKFASVGIPEDENNLRSLWDECNKLVRNPTNGALPANFETAIRGRFDIGMFDIATLKQQLSKGFIANVILAFSSSSRNSRMNYMAELLMNLADCVGRIAILVRAQQSIKE